MFDNFETTVRIITYSTLLMSMFQLYLRANKIWKRKQEQEVAESQSIAGLSLLMLNCLIWFVYYIIESDYASLIDTSIIMAEAFLFLLISTGLWVKRPHKLTFWKLVKQALKLERKEADYLLKRFFKPINAEKIIQMLHQLAMIDNEFDPNEQAILESFAKEWNIDYKPDRLNKEQTKVTSENYMRLRKNLEEYLKIDPPIEQVAQLKDMMQAIINADEKITDEEELISSELMGIISNYLKREEKIDLHHVLIVPQKPEHEGLIQELMPEALKVNISGGIAYSVGAYYSNIYAEMICKQFRQAKMFTIVHSPEDEEEFQILER